MLLADHPDFTVRAVHCRDDHTGWSPAEPARAYGVVLVRSGRFRRHADRAGEVLADRTVGYVSVPGLEERFAHPAGGDICTSIHLSGSLWHQLRAGGGPGTAGHIYVDARLELAHRLLLRAARRPDLDFATAERLLHLLGAALPAAGAAAARPETPATARADRAAVETVREAVTAGHPAAGGLLPLARLVGLSPYRLSRAFHREVGVPLTRFRNRVRVGEALTRLEAGESSLGRLAADLGFADQAHLTRTVRAHAGGTPAQLRQLLRD